MATIVPDMKNRMLFFLVVLLIAAFVPALPTGAQTLLRVATPGALTGALPKLIATRNEQMNMQALMSDSVQFFASSSTGLFYLGSKQGLDCSENCVLE